MKPVSSLFAKILCWFILNMTLVAAVLAIFFTLQSQVTLKGVWGQVRSSRLRTAGMLIAHDLAQTPRAQWSDLLSVHAAIHQVDFVLVLGDGRFFSSTDLALPPIVLAKAREALRHNPSRNRLPPPPGQRPGGNKNFMRDAGGGLSNQGIAEMPPAPPREWGQTQQLVMRTKDPRRYWAGIQIRLPSAPFRPPSPAFLFAVSDSVTGGGFFFDPLPWVVVAAVVILISMLFWIPMVRHITRPLSRMTRAAEQIAQGRFDVAISEKRSDEIGRLAQTINHMTERLSRFVNGQKRFLGDVAHELGSPIARIQFGLGALEQRIDSANRQRVVDVMEETEHMSQLVNELLAFSRADLKADSIKLERSTLLSVVQMAVKQESMTSVNIVIQVDPEIRVVASTELLTRAIANLLRNAVKYAGDAGPIYIIAEKKHNRVKIEVRDSGPGVPEDLLDRLFEPFFRPEASRDRDSGGVGLGLAIVKTCIETCHGTLSARNLQPRGFAVTITLGS